ncbi:hypothetical protein A4A49_12175 [Nicotiana attenuata]|uniref:Uncharacterized protein n=1 Tax=Nicotiana attenuata TaxID=49451 RepID=A0A1J6INY4_NICAT|nr:hypothetical protein A4A49_12175 [Nicotiana attenuata]
MMSNMLKEAVILMVITTIVVSLVSAQDDPYHKCVDECYSTCFADIAGCYEYCKQDCKHPNFSASKFHQCSVDACLKLKGDKKLMEVCLNECRKNTDKIKV